MHSRNKCVDRVKYVIRLILAIIFLLCVDSVLLIFHEKKIKNNKNKLPGNENWEA